jgi:Lamin Tail Domain
MGTAAGSSDEWIEIYNPGISCINLSTGWVLKIADSGISINIAGTINPGGYFILADNGSVFQNVIINQSTTNLSLLNDGEALYLIGPDGYTQVDSANWWDGNWPAGIANSLNSNLAYSSMERIGTVADSPSAWVTFAGSITSTPLDRRGNHVHGTPGMSNWAWTVTEAPSAMPTATHKPTPTFAATPVPVWSSMKSCRVPALIGTAIVQSIILMNALRLKTLVPASLI